MYYNLELFCFNVKVLRFFGILELKTAYRAGVLFVLQLVMYICQILNLFFVWTNISVLSITFFMSVGIFNSLVRIWTLMRNQSNLIKFMKDIEHWYKEVEVTNDKIAWNILKHLPKKTRSISNTAFAFGAASAISMAAYPLFLEQRTLIFPIYTIGLDALKSPLYETLYVAQSFIILPFVVGTYVPLTNLFISYLLFGTSLLQILHKKLQELPPGNDCDLERSLKVLINYHQRIIRYGQTLEKLFSFVCFVEFLIFSMMLCILLLCFLLIDSAANNIITIIYVFSVLYLLFILYWHTNEFSLESLKLANAAYDIDWTHSSMEVRKCVLILLIRCQTPLKISAGGIYPMTLETFQAILNASYAYFNMFNGLMAK